MRGFSFVEVLVALILLSIMLLGFDGVGTLILKKEQEITATQIAEMQMENIRERLLSLHHLNGLDQIVTCWNKENQIILPDGLGKVTGHFPTYQVTLRWGNASLQHCQNLVLGRSGCFQEQIQLA